MTMTQRGLVALMLLCGAWASAQTQRRDPHIGYIYPAGGQIGTVVYATLGGQNLRAVDAVHVSGAGVQARVIKHYPPLRNLSPEQREALATRFYELVAKGWAKLQKKGSAGNAPPWRALGFRGPARQAREASTTQPVELPAHPLLYDLEHKSLRELLHVRTMLANLRKGQQPNPQIGESVLIELTLARDASQGDRELRLLGPLGLTNPLTFEVGAWREVAELEANDPDSFDPLPPEPPLETPVVLNGQILPGDVDRFRFHAAAGQRLVIETHARRLIPYLADAVPGWFQAAVALYSPDGQEVAFDDDYRFDPDPVFCYDVSQDGDYVLEIRDALYRGREDFVYRVLVGKRPFITGLFPLGGQTGQGRLVSIEGWNLPSSRLFIDAEEGAERIRQRCLGVGAHTSNPVAYAVDPLPADKEQEPNDDSEHAQRVRLPRIINGRIGAPGDVDVFVLQGKGGDTVVAEVVARRVNSPLDALLRLTDATGTILAWNDDYEFRDGILHTADGVLTHSADARLEARLPTDGAYYVHVLDAQGAGGSAYAYRLRISPPRPDFELRVTPSSLNVAAGGCVPLTVHALRIDGFDGPIELAVKDGPAGLTLAGARIPPGRDRVRCTLASARQRMERPAALQFEGRATIDGRLVTRVAVPADDVEQAFLYRHLVPAQQMLLAVLRGRVALLEKPVVRTDLVRLRRGGHADLWIDVPERLMERAPAFELSEPPAGISIEEVTEVVGGVVLTLRAGDDMPPTGLRDNLILECFGHFNRVSRGKATGERQRVSLGFLPAVRLEVTP